MRLHPFVAWLAIFGGLSAATHAQTASARGVASAADPEIQALLAPLLEKHDVPALAAAIVLRDGTTRVGVAGVRKRGAPELVSVNDRFHIGSCTKAMTATLIARLIERGAMDWSTRVVDVFPELKHEIHADFAPVTVLELLHHRSGVGNDLTRGGAWARLQQRQGSLTEQRVQLVRDVLRDAPAQKPGEHFEYSNAGYAIAGAMAERVTKTPFEELIRRELFEPLGMASAGFGAPGAADRNDEPRGHAPRSGEAIEPGPSADNPPGIAPAGTVHCSLGDWAKFVALHLQASQADTRLLKKATAEKLHTPPTPGGYACGWGQMERPWGGTVYTHAGSNTLWYCVVWMAPEKGFAALVATNTGEPGAALACDDAAGALIGLCQKSDKP